MSGGWSWRSPDPHAGVLAVSDWNCCIACLAVATGDLNAPGQIRISGVRLAMAYLTDLDSAMNRQPNDYARPQRSAAVVLLSLSRRRPPSRRHSYVMSRPAHARVCLVYARWRPKAALEVARKVLTTANAEWHRDAEHHRPIVAGGIGARPRVSASKTMRTEGTPMATRYTRADIARLASAVEKRNDDPTRHKCFISYHTDDADDVADFLDEFGGVFIPRTIGVTEDDPFIDSDDDYIKARISSKYMSDSTVTILLVGECTWGRKFVDWEIGATLRNSPKNKRSGLLAYKLTSANENQKIPDRLKDNWSKNTESYADYYAYPTSSSSVRRSIDEAFEARQSRAHLVENGRALRRKNTCP